MYKFTCSCCNATYYGESERHFFVRASEHLGMPSLTGKRVKSPKRSAIFDLILLKDHDTSFEDLTILMKEKKEFKLQLKESLLIKIEKTKLNRNIICILLFTYLLHELSLHVIFMTFFKLLIAVHRCLKMLPMREGSEICRKIISYFNHLNVDTASNLDIHLFFFAKSGSNMK